jgi:hypothetical protein
MLNHYQAKYHNYNSKRKYQAMTLKTIKTK